MVSYLRKEGRKKTQAQTLISHFSHIAPITFHLNEQHVDDFEHPR